MTLTVVMPCYNERATIREIVARVQAVDLGPVGLELLIVDDGSTDGTRDILAELDGTDGVRVLLQPVNQGKGAAVARGFREATGDLVLIQDADLEYDPDEYPHAAQAHPRRQGRRRLRLALPRHAQRPPRAVFLALDRQPAADAALERVHRPEPDRHGDLLQGLRRATSRSASTCSRATSASSPRSPARSPACGARVFEVPISYNGRTYEEGKKIGLKDAFKAVYTLLRFARWEAPADDVGARTLRRMAGLDGLQQVAARPLRRLPRPARARGGLGRRQPDPLLRRSRTRRRLRHRAALPARAAPALRRQGATCAWPRSRSRCRTPTAPTCAPNASTRSCA